MAAISAEQLPAFPAGKTSRLTLPQGASRRAVLTDVPFLRQLYWSFRAEEMQPVPWLQEMKQAFVDRQFNLQHHHYVTTFRHADFLILQDGAEPIGRLYIDTSPEHWHIIDIGFLAEWRNRGRGLGMLKEIQCQAQACASGILLHVERRNTRAQALYSRLHFHEVDGSDTHIRMQWPAA